MPIYEYRCVRCGHQFDVTHAVGKTRARCEKCGGAVRRVFTSVGIIFKGSGFHVNDYRKTPAPPGGDGPAGGVSSPGAPGRGERDRAQGGDAKEGSVGKAAGGGKSAPATEASRGSGSSEKNGKARSATAPSQGAGTKSS